MKLAPTHSVCFLYLLSYIDSREEQTLNWQELLLFLIRTLMVHQLDPKAESWLRKSWMRCRILVQGMEQVTTLADLILGWWKTDTYIQLSTVQQNYTLSRWKQCDPRGGHSAEFCRVPHCAIKAIPVSKSKTEDTSLWECHRLNKLSQGNYHYLILITTITTN